MCGKKYHITYLHLLQLFGISQVAWRGFIGTKVMGQEHISPEHESFFHVLQHLSDGVHVLLQRVAAVHLVVQHFLPEDTAQLGEHLQMVYGDQRGPQAVVQVLAQRRQVIAQLFRGPAEETVEARALVLANFHDEQAGGPEQHAVVGFVLLLQLGQGLRHGRRYYWRALGKVRFLAVVNGIFITARILINVKVLRDLPTY